MGGKGKIAKLLPVLVLLAIALFAAMLVFNGKLPSPTGLVAGEKANMPPEWTAPSTKFVIEQNHPVLLNLGELFKDPEGQSITFTATSTENLDVKLEGEILKITPEPGFKGVRIVTVFASDGTQVSRKRLNIDVGNSPTEVPEPVETQPAEQQATAPVLQQQSAPQQDVAEQALEDALKGGQTVRAIIIMKDAAPTAFSAKSTRLEKRAAINSIKAKVRQNREALLAKVKGANGITGAAVADNDVQVVRQYDTVNAIAVMLTESGLAKLKNDASVEKIILDRVFKADLSQSVPLINATNVWNVNVNGQTITGKGKTICIIDTGIDMSHPAFSGKILPGYDFVNNDANPQDDAGNSHGTHVSGIAAGNSTEVKGVAPDALIVPVKVCDSSGSCDGNAILAGIDYCNYYADAFNISVISGSLGDNSQYTSADCPTWFDSALSTSAGLGIIPVFASGNNGYTGGVSYPACSPYAISVGSSGKSDTLETYTNRGGDRFDVLAPGGNIVSSVIGGGTGAMSGTSMATPHVSGAVALIQQDDDANGRLALTVAQIRNALESTGVSVSGLPRINVLAAIELANASMLVNDTEHSVSSVVPPKAKIQFKDSVALDTISSCADLGYNFASIDSVACPQYNKSARITFEGMPQANFRILRDGAPCPETICQNITFNGGTLGFDVTEFSNYSTNISFGTQSTCASLLSNTVLDSDVTSATTCFTFFFGDISLDCAGHNVTFNTGGTDYGYGVDASTMKGITIKNCIIRSGNTAGSTVRGIYFNGVNHSTIFNNSIINSGTQSTNDHDGILIANCQQSINITSNWVNISGNNSFGISFTGANQGANARIINNTILVKTTGTGTQNNGLGITNTINFLSTGNNITLNDSSDSQGMYFGSFDQYGNVENNSITIQGASSNNIGIDLEMLVKNINFTGNKINVSGTTNTRGIYLYYTTGNLFRFTNITTTGTPPNYGINTYDSNSTFNSTRIENSETWVYMYSFNFLDRLVFDNTTFATPYGSINILKNFSMDFSFEELNNSDVNVTLNRSYMKSTTLGRLNQSGIVTLTGLSGNFGTLRVNYADAGAYADCPSSVCNLLSSSGGTVVFNVSHFTTFAANMSSSSQTCSDCAGCTACAATAGNTCTLTGAITNTTRCITVGADNVTINCAGNTITYDTDGSISLSGILANYRKNITIQNCNIKDTNAAGDNTNGISFTGTNNSLITNNNITANGTYNTFGIYLTSNSQNNRVTGNIVTNRGTDTDNHAIDIEQSVNNTIAYNVIRANGSLYTFGIFTFGAHNTTITGNNITTNGTTNNWGIETRYTGSINITRNNIQTIGGSGGVGIYLDTIENSTIAYNNISTGFNATTTNSGIIESGGQYNNITGNTIATNGTSGNDGIALTSVRYLNVAYNNITARSSTGGSTDGVYLQSAYYNNISMNNIFAFGTWGMQVTVSENNTIAQNNITATSSITGAIGMYVTNSAKNNNITLNTIQTICPNNCHGISLWQNAIGNLFVQDSITTNGTYSFGIMFELTSSNNSFNAMLLNDTGRWINSSTNSGNNNFTNTTFAMPNGSINILPTISLNGSQEITKSQLNITANKAYLNSTNLTYFNTTAIIKLYSISYTTPKIRVDYADNGGYVDCTADTCTNLSYSGNVFAFNTTHFTSYQAAEGSTIITSCPVTINSSVTLTQNLVSNTSCMVINNSNTVLDCHGYNITFNQKGGTDFGINASNVTAVVIRNCTIIEANITGASTGIYLLDVSNSTIAYNNITVNGSFSYASNGIQMTSTTGTDSSNNNTVANNTIQIFDLTGSFGILINYNNANHQILGNRINVVNGTPINILWYANNILIAGNQVRLAASGGSLGIGLQNTNNSLFENNTVEFGAPGAGYRGITISSDSNNNTVSANNFSSTMEKSSPTAIIIQANNNYALNNLINISGRDCEGITVSGINTTVTGNNIRTNCNITAKGVFFSNAQYNTVAYNNITGVGPSAGIIGISSYGLYLFAGTYNNLTQNNITVNGTGNSFGVYLRSNSRNNLFTGNLISSSGGSGGNLGINIDSSDNNTFDLNTILTNGTESYGILLAVSMNNTFNRTLLNNTAQWINLTPTTENNTFLNTTFAMPNGSISVSGFTINANTTVTKAKLNISGNRAFLNSSNLSALNTSAIITLYNISYQIPKAQVDYADNGGYADCPASQCANLSYSGNAFAFNTTHFTSYQAAEGSSLISCNSCADCTACASTAGNICTLTGSITNTTHCITVNADNVTINCAGNTITYDTAGGDSALGISASYRQNITIQNCNIKDTNAAGNSVNSISFTGTNNSLITNNNITTNGTYNNFGIYLFLRSQNNLVTGNIVINRGTDTDNHAIHVEQSINNTIAYNVIRANGSLYAFGIVALYAHNATIIGNNITTNGTTNNWGIETRFTGSINITRNNIQTAGGSGGAGIYLDTIENSTIAYNNISTGFNATTDNAGIAESAGKYNNITGNTIATNGTTGNDGIALASDSHINVAYNNITARSSTTGGTSGISMQYSHYGNISSNNILTFGKWGMQVTVSENNTIAQNNITATSSITGAIGMYVQNNAKNNNITLNTIQTICPNNCHGISLWQNAMGNLFVQDSITTNGTYSFGIMFELTSSNNSFNAMLLNDTGRWINSSTNSGNNNFTNMTYAMPNGSINILPTISLNGSLEITKAKLNITNSVAFLNSSNLTYFNTTGIITLYGINYIDPSPKVDWNDDGVYEKCTSAVCTELSYTPGVSFVFNVTHFTGYTAYESAITGCPIDVNETSYLANDITSPGTCINIINSNLELDCNGHTITFGTAGTDLSYGINITSPGSSGIWNVTVRNCVASKTSVGNNGYGISLYNTTRAIITRNNLSVFDSGNNFGINIASSTGNIFSFNRVSTDGAGGSNFGIYVAASTQNLVENNTIYTNGSSSGNVGIHITGPSNNISNNTIYTHGTGGTNPGILLGYAHFNRIYGNTIITNQGGENHGIHLRGSSYCVVENNSVSSNGSVSHGILLNSGSQYDNITGNTIFSGTGSQSHGIRIENGSNSNVFRFNSVTTVGASSYAISILNANYSIINATLLNDSTSWINANTNTLNNITNITFQMPYGSINILPISQLNGTQDITKAKLYTSSLFAFMNSSNLSALNTTGIITLNGVNFIDPKPIVDWNDDSGYENCPADICTELSYTPGASYAFNVSHFTGFMAAENATAITSCPVIINNSAVIGNDISSNDTCITINASNLELDCNGHTIAYNAHGSDNEYGIAANNFTNISVRNCNIMDINESGLNGYAVYFTNISNSTVENNNITTNGTGSNQGLVLQTNLNNNITNNKIATRGSAYINYGIYLFDSSSGNRITGNNITTNGTYSNYGISLDISANNNIIDRNIVSPGGNSDFNVGIYLKQLSSGNNITNNNITTNGGSNNNYGITLENGTNNTVSSNIVSTNGTGDLNYGIYFYYQASGNSITNNNITTNGGSNSNDGIGFSSDTNDNIISGNKITAGGRASYNIGISLLSFTARNNITNNEISTSGTERNTGINLEDFAENNILYNNTITTSGTDSYAIEIINSNYSTFNNTILNNPAQWIKAGINNVSITNITNTTFAMPDGSINIPGTVQLNDPIDATKAMLNITANRAFLNSAALPALNTIGIITLNSIFYTSPQPRVDFSDTGNLVNCPSSICNNFTYSGNTFVINVTHFTTYAAGNDTIIINSTIIDSNISNCTIINSTVINSTKSNCTIINSNIINSTNNNTVIIGTNETNSLDNDTVVDNSIILDSVKINSTINGSTKVNSTIINSNIINSTNNNSVIINTNETNSTDNDSVVDNSIIIGSTKINSTINGSTKVNSTIINSNVLNSTNYNSTLIDSNETNSTDINSTVDRSIIIDATKINSIINNSNITNSTINSTIVINSTINSSNLTNCTVTNSTLNGINNQSCNYTNYNGSITPTPTPPGGQSGGGGGGGIRITRNITQTSGGAHICTESWSCQDWTRCDGTTQTRVCEELNGCNTTMFMPAVSRACTPEIPIANPEAERPVIPPPKLAQPQIAAPKASLPESMRQVSLCTALPLFYDGALIALAVLALLSLVIGLEKRSERMWRSAIGVMLIINAALAVSNYASCKSIMPVQTISLVVLLVLLLAQLIADRLRSAAPVVEEGAEAEEEPEAPAEPKKPEQLKITKVALPQKGTGADTEELLGALKRSGDALEEFEKAMKKLRKNK